MHFFVDFLRSRLHGWRPTSGGWVTGNCPVCVRMGEPRPDRKQRGGFQFGDDEWGYHCFNCGFSTGWKAGKKMSWGNRTLLEGLGYERSDIQRLSLELMREEETANLLNPLPDLPPPFKPNWPDMELPEGATLLEDTPPPKMHRNFELGIEMLAERDLLHWTDWGHTASDFKFRKRIILPYRYRTRIVGYNARYIGNPPDSKTPKYLVTKPPHFVFNLDQQSFDRNTVVVTEGDYDAISIDGVSVGTNSVSDEQASLINQLHKKVVVLPDADAAGQGLIEPAIKQGWAVSFPEWMSEFKDANAACIALGRPLVLQSVLMSATDNPTKIRVLSKKMLK
jgi:hypothetical protein